MFEFVHLLFVGSTAAFVLHNRMRKARKDNDSREMVTYSGSCHCKKVTFQVTAPAHLIIWRCNCSVCDMKQNLHFIVPKSRFTLLTGMDSLKLYTFNTHTAKHYFCKHCGVQSFYVINLFYNVIRIKWLWYTDPSFEPWWIWHHISLYWPIQGNIFCIHCVMWL